MPQVAAIKSDAVTLTWRAPSEDGGSAITGYVIEYRIEGGFKWLLANDTETVTQPKYTVKHLTENMEYEFRVAAVNKAGVGDYAQCATPITVREPVGTSCCVSVKYLFDKAHFFHPSFSAPLQYYCICSILFHSCVFILSRSESLITQSFRPNMVL